MKVSLKMILKNNLFLMRLIVKFSPILLWSVIVGSLAFAFLQVFTTMIFIRSLVRRIEEGSSFNEILILLLLGGLTILFLRAFEIVIENYIKPVYSQKLIQGLEAFLYNKAKTFDLSCYDDANFYNEYIWATHNSGEFILDAIKSIGEFFRYIFQLTGIIGIVISIDASMGIIILLAVIITMVITAKKEKIVLTYKKETMNSEKKRNYIVRMFYLKDSAKDIRLTNIYTKFIEFYNESYEELNQIIKKYAHKVAWLSFAPVFFLRYLISTFAVYLYFSYKLIVLGTMLISDFIAVNSGMVSLYLSLTRFSDQMNSLYKNTLYIESMRAFIDYQPKINSIANAKNVPESEFVFEFKDVTFKYPAEETPTLNKINLTIHSKKTLAIVGFNGAGKTTLIKLLLRLYDVNSGEILLNGINIKDYDLKQYRNFFTVAFQDFQIFAATLGENVMMDRVTEENRNSILKALDFADFTEKYQHLPTGLETPLTREFEEDGVLFSGGEMQKIAIARVLSKDSRVAILDEPSAALDPISEYNINDNMTKLSKQKTVVFISHRLTSTVMADHIVMLENGKIIEEGTHQQLLATHGRYAEMFRVQSKQYKQTS
ncbi:ABC transporter ATP-binding protein [Bacillus sp. SD088]|uniref:ABC transporter ATP-binding protein n=1 Tax=Bacillus sp. SD088 TaxID=2782012 RepID=UPI001A9623F9|nr:ABC transporter ATP-binding protein [Bacillus sp. SD088]MBO0995762.1 ABC transporter ATP-binding protein [Bacillus sp. SD088]